MKSIGYPFIILSLVLLIMACNQTDSVPEDKSVTRSYAESYNPPVFTDDNRAATIRSLAPQLEALMREHIKSSNIPGVSYGIVVDDELVVSSSLGFMNLETNTAPTTQSVFRIASMTKSFTAMAIMKLREQGKLSLHDPVGKYIPEMNTMERLTADAPQITIENLLTMTAGFPEDNPWGDRQLHEPDSMLIDLIEQGIAFSNVPSFAYEYSNTGYAMLGLIIRNITGMPYQTFIRNTIFKPLGMHHTYWEYDSVPDAQMVLGYRWEDEQWKPEPLLHDGAFGSMGGLITSIEDFCKYVSFQLAAWPPRSTVDKGPVKRSSLRKMQTPQFSRLYAGAKDYNGDPCAVLSGYGYGLSIRTNCKGLTRVSHGGALPGYGSNYVYYPEYGIGIMAFCNLTYTSPYPINAIEKLLFESEAIQPRKLPVSTVLEQRKEQVLQLIQEWDPELESDLLAENFYLDKSRQHRMEAVQEILNKAGEFKSVGELNPTNQLRGGFTVDTAHGTIQIYFTLTPERDPKVQALYVQFMKAE